MANAFKCDRCGKISTDMTEATYHTRANLLFFIPIGSKDSNSVDLCPMCQKALEIALKVWWHGLASK